jgi:glycosyltransferase involved in cell wall biosynthesis
MSGTRSIAAVGDVSSPSCWSGTPFHFLEAARRSGFVTNPVRIDLTKLHWPRRVWNLKQLLLGLGRGGFQYSDRFLDLIEAQVPPALWQGEVVSFNQHFPRAATVAHAGGRLSHYLDAPFAALVTGGGLDLRLPPAITRRALAQERENYAASERVITMARWAAEAIVSGCGVAAEKCHVILPGANFDLPEDWEFTGPETRAGRDRDFTLGFIGKDWRRKGLPYLLDLRDQLARRGWRVRVLAAGTAPPELIARPGLEFAGYLDKRKNAAAFHEFLTRCDLGCLFSEREALGISTLEFLRAGVPVAGFAHEGLADTLPPDAGFRFAPGTPPEEAADQLEAYLENESRQADFARNAQRWSPLVSWERCVREFEELWKTGTVSRPVQLWRGNDDSPPP